MVDEKRVVQLFMDLVQIDSETLNERLMADRLKEELIKRGLTVEEDSAGKEIGGNAGNLIAILPGKTEAPTVLLSAHMDRVKPGNGVKPILKDGVISSQGETILAADDIAGVVAILEGLQVIKEQDLNHGPIKILFTVAEEGGLNGVKNVDPTKIQADYGFCYDADGNVGTIITEGPAQYRFEAVIHGKAAHAGIDPKSGVDAIRTASMAISEMKLGQIDELTTANIGVIRGGRATNIVPDEVELLGEARSRKRDRLETQVEHMRDIVQRSADHYGASAEIKTTLMYPEFSFAPSEKIIQIFFAANSVIQTPLRVESSGGGSDANILNGYGIPTVNLGIGMKKVHSVDEYITVENLKQAAEMTVAIVQHVCGMKG